VIYILVAGVPSLMVRPTSQLRWQPRSDHLRRSTGSLHVPVTAATIGHARLA